LKRAAIELFKKFDPLKVLIEDKASGTALIQELKSDYILLRRGVQACARK